jgi:uncharacterized protein
MREHASHSIDPLHALLEELSHLLPAQGPIGVFIHHNTLHAFQHLPFERAVVDAAGLFGAEPYMSEDAYRAELRRGRIRREDIDAVLAAEPNAPILPGRLDRNQLRSLLLQHPESHCDPATIQWRIEEGKLFTAAESDLFHACLERVSTGPKQHPTAPVRPRDGIFARCGVDIDDDVHQGYAYWPMPARERGFFAAALTLLAQPCSLEAGNLSGLAAECRRQLFLQCGAADSIRDSLEAFAIPISGARDFLREELLALPGWAGIFNQLENHPQLAPHVRLPASLADYLALRLLLVKVAAGNALNGKMLLWRTPLCAPAEDRLAIAARWFDTLRRLGLSAAEVRTMLSPAWSALAAEIHDCGSLELRRLFHLAYERRHERQILLPLATFRRDCPPRPAGSPPAAQVFFCIDEREESIRRHLEEIDPAIHTYGAAGFFGVAINYEGIDDAHAVDLCPVVVTPQHAVRERVPEADAPQYARRLSLRRAWARIARSGFIASRSLVRGWLATATVGAFSLLPLLVRILTPRQYTRLRNLFNEILVPRPETELSFTHAGDAEIHGLQFGFSIPEQADRVAGVLAAAGLTANFSPLVVVLGHGSTSLNNPHESAHDCGACGGRRGGPNARLFAAMANHPDVRAALAVRGVAIPDSTWFLGGYHDTCSDDVEIYDLQLLPASLGGLFLRVRSSLDKARAASAQERARRFEFANSARDGKAALLHVEERSDHLAEPRPEYGHCTNSVCFVGRRALTRGLFFDRRAFLVSYDATIDPDGLYLARQLGAVVPVCGGISLEYYFSFVDNERYGCGTKLPHNVTGLIGVMNGQSSDLRTGLPWQMVEIHEPVRILFVVDASEEIILATFSSNPTIREFLENRWIRLAAIHPDSGAVSVYRDGRFEALEGEPQDLPIADSSAAWYGGRMEHLPVARIQIAEAHSS